MVATGIPDWHLAILRERIAEADAHPEAGIPWKQVRAELWPDGLGVGTDGRADATAVSSPTGAHRGR